MRKKMVRGALGGRSCRIDDEGEVNGYVDWYFVVQKETDGKF